MTFTTAKVHCTSVDEAIRLVNELIRMESRGAGDTENAMRRLAHRYGLNWRVFWTLRYRRPKDVFVSVFEKLQAAHRAECGRQIERLRHELEIAKINGVHVEDIADQAATLIAELEGCLQNNRDGEP